MKTLMVAGLMSFAVGCGANPLSPGTDSTPVEIVDQPETFEETCLGSAVGQDRAVTWNCICESGSDALLRSLDTVLHTCNNDSFARLDAALRAETIDSAQLDGACIMYGRAFAEFETCGDDFVRLSRQNDCRIARVANQLTANEFVVCMSAC